MKYPFYGNYVVYQYYTDEEDKKTDKYFVIAIVLSEFLAEKICEDNHLAFYEKEEFYLVQ